MRTPMRQMLMKRLTLNMNQNLKKQKELVLGWVTNLALLQSASL